MPRFVAGASNPQAMAKQWRKNVRDWASGVSSSGVDARKRMAAQAAAAPAQRQESIEAAARRLAREEEARKASLRSAEERKPLSRFGFDLSEGLRLKSALIYKGHNLVRRRPEETAATGLRLYSMDMLQAQLISKRPCSACGRRGVLVASAMLEEHRGLGSTIRCWCTHCRKVTDEFNTSRTLPTSGKGRALMEVNARAYLGACQAGVGHAAALRLLGSLDLHTPSKACWSRVGKEVKAAMIQVGNASERSALLLERRLAFSASGGALDADGRVGVAISFDGAWSKRGNARNSQEGIATAIGCRSGQVVASGRRSKQCSRCKPDAPCGRADCTANHVGSSGSMEPALGIELVNSLNADQAGIFVEDLVTDLDAKVHSAVAAACEAAGEVTPRQRSDPNHAMKAAKKKMLPDAKKAVGQRGALSTRAIEQLIRELAFALNRHRGCGDADLLKRALLNVIDHAFGRHGNCLDFFDCPCASGSGAARPQASAARRHGSSYNAAGDWLGDMPGGAQVEAVLRREWQARLTAPDKLQRLLHGWATQRNEAFNGLHVCLQPKRMHLAATDAGLARLKLTVARFNDGCLSSTEAVLKHIGVGEVGQHARRALSSLDRQRLYDARRMAQPKYKGRRRDNKKRRKIRDQAQPGQAGAYAAGVGLDGDDDGGDEVGEVSHLQSARQKLASHGGDARRATSSSTARLSVPEMRALLADSGAEVGGNRDALVERLIARRGGGGAASGSSGDPPTSPHREWVSSDESDEGEPDWSQLEVGSAALAQGYPAYADLLGSDVCVMGAAFAPEFVLHTRGAVGWRGEVTDVRGRSIAHAQVEVFGTWFALSDVQRMRPIRPE